MSTLRSLASTVVCISSLLLLLLSGCGGGSSGPPGAIAPPAPTVTSEADLILHMDQVRASE